MIIFQTNLFVHHETLQACNIGNIGFTTTDQKYAPSVEVKIAGKLARSIDCLGSAHSTDCLVLAHSIDCFGPSHSFECLVTANSTDCLVPANYDTV